MATTKELKDGLTLEEIPCDEGKHMKLTNSTVDKQFIVKYGFKSGDPTPMGDTKIEGGKYILSVHPGETLDFVKGKWNGLTKSIATGPCSKEWQEKQAGKAKEGNANELEKVKQLIIDNKLKDSDAAAVAQLCEKNKIPFIDTTFLPLDNSLQSSWQKGDMKMYPFKRPSQWELLSDKGLKPSLFVNKIEPADINQGALADCYLMGALSSVAKEDYLVQQMFSEKQNPDLGIYRVKLCKDAWWRTVTIDDFLPCSGPKPAFARNRDEPEELWVGLVEKAYSKVNGSYFAMKTGQCAAALADLTGCPYKTTAVSDDLWDSMLQQSGEGVLQVFGTPGKNLMYVDEKLQKPDDKKMWEEYRAVELICEHSYSVLKCITTKKGEKLVKLRNPWGTTDHGLWKGKWSLSDPAWTPAMKSEVVWDETDGVFWMSWNDCCKWFNSVAVGYNLPTWESVRVKGQWEKGVSSVCIEIDVKEKTQMWVGLHQSDTRGIKPGSCPNASLCNMNLFVVAPKKDGVKVVESYGCARRDRFGLLNLDPAQGKLFIIGQPKDGSISKNFVLSLCIEKLDAVSVFFNGPKDAKHYETAKDVVLTHWEPREVTYQIQGPKLSKKTIIEQSGKQLGCGEPATREIVKPTKKAAAETNGAESPKKPAMKKATKFAEPDSPKATKFAEPDSPKKAEPKKAAKFADPASPEVPKKTAKFADPSSPKAAVRSGSGGAPGSKSAMTSAAMRSKTTAAPSSKPLKPLAKPAPKKDLTVEVLLVKATSLISKGSQNPFCELKLRTVSASGVVGSDHPTPQKQTSKVVNKNLSPNWNEKFKFNVPGSDCIRISIFGKKMMGKDYLGRVDVLASDLSELLDTESTASKTFKISGEDEGRGPVSGTMDITFRRL